MRSVLCVAFVLSGLVGCLRPTADLPRPNEFPLFFEPEGACAPSREARVECTLDGDTFDVGACGDEVGERVRMLGINAPEIAHEEPAECYGDIAANALRELLNGRAIVLGFDYECQDRYGRTLAYAWFEDPVLAPPSDDGGDADDDTGSSSTNYVFANAWMLENGYARLAPEDWTTQEIQQQDVMVAAEQRAREAGVGLWGACPL